MEYIYSAMLLHSLGHKVEEHALKKVVEAAGGKVDDGKIRALVSALQSVDIEKAIKEAALPIAAPAVTEAKAEKKEEKKEEKKNEEAAAAGLGALFS